MDSKNLLNMNKYRENITLDFNAIMKRDGELICPECEVGNILLNFDIHKDDISSYSRCSVCRQSYLVNNLPTSEKVFVINIPNHIIHELVYKELLKVGFLEQNKHYSTSIIYNMHRAKEEIMGVTFCASEGDAK